MNVSASKVNDLLKCSYSFYAKNVLLLPDKTHPKTHQGSCVHDIIECLLKTRKKDRLGRLHYILNDGFSFTIVPAALRFARFYAHRHKLADFPYADIERMIALAFTTIRDPLMSPSGTWASEQRFEFKVGRANCTGFIDFLYVSLTDQGGIWDYKTKGQRFTKNELTNNIQAAIYQLWYHEQYHKLVPVHFVMLRFPPNSRNPSYHIQTVKAPSLDKLEGLRLYIDSLHGVINNFGIEQAHSNPCPDEFFCDRVCQLRKPFKYNAVYDSRDNTLVGNYFVEDTPAVGPEQYVEGRTYSGCPFRSHR